MSKVTIFLTSLTLFGFLSAQADDVFRADQNFGGDMPVAVSYTHLTLPTICSV